MGRQEETGEEVVWDMVGFRGNTLHLYPSISVASTNVYSCQIMLSAWRPKLFTEIRERNGRA